MFRIRHGLLLVSAFAFLGCIAVPRDVLLSDPEVKSLLQARAVVDTASLGFSPIPAKAAVVLTSAPGGDRVRLHIAADTSRTIAFRKTAGGFKWVGEHEVYTGPKTYAGDNGTLHERISIFYQKEDVWDAPLNQIYFTYDGPDHRLAYQFDLTLESIRPILAEWKRIH